MWDLTPHCDPFLTPIRQECAAHQFPAAGYAAESGARRGRDGIRGSSHAVPIV